MIAVFSGQSDFFGWLETKRISFEEDDQSVKEILAAVRQDGDKAVRAYVRKFDGIELERFSVSQQEMDEAEKGLDPDIRERLLLSYANILEYHQKQKQNHWFYEKPGQLLGQLVRPIEKVGLYVPGGKGIYPSSVLMTAIPAQVAGVSETYVITPCNKEGKVHPVVLAAAKICGVTGVFKVGGAQGVAAFAYGTAQIPKVYKIVGPGNKYVTLAKKYLYGTIDIDSLAGPSEVLILADKTTPLDYLAADFFAQAEHSEDAQAVVLVPDQGMAQKVARLFEERLALSPRRAILEKSIRDNSCIVVYRDLEEAYAIANEYAAEHLEVLSDAIDFYEITANIKNAGALFIGVETPVALGDYFAGPNHTLPTNGTAKYASPLGVYDFVKYTSILRFKKGETARVAPFASPLAELEGFYEHANSIKVRK